MELITLEENLPKLLTLNTNLNESVMTYSYEKSDDFYLNGRSFNDVKGNPTEQIQFTFVAMIHKEALKKLLGMGGKQKIKFSWMMVQHEHVQWYYQFTLESIAEGNYQLNIESQGPSLNKNKEVPLGGFGNNLPDQIAPKVFKAICGFVMADESLFDIDMEKDGDGFKSSGGISAELLNSILNGEKTDIIKLQAQLIIPLAYFQLSNILPIQDAHPVVINTDVIESILKGDKVRGTDWVITVGESGSAQPKDYHVHGQLLSHGSPILERAIRTHSSAEKEQILMISHENRFILPTIHADDMRCLLNYFYQRRFITPHWLAFARVGRVFANLARHRLMELFVAWQEEMVQEAKQLDKKDFKKTMLRLAELLTGLYAAPYGSMPVAKKVLISLMADVFHMAKDAGINRDELMVGEPFENRLFELSMRSLTLYLSIVTTTDKEFV